MGRRGLAGSIGAGIAGILEMRAMKKSTSKEKKDSPGPVKVVIKNRARRHGPVPEEERMPHGRTIHNGSAGAFDATEHSHDEDDEDQDNDDFAMDQ